MEFRGNNRSFERNLIGDQTSVTAIAESGTKFEDIEIQDGEWYEYDEKSSQQVSLTEVSTFVRGYKK